MTTALGASGTAAHAALPARNPGTPLDLGGAHARARQPQRGRAPRRDARHAPHGQEGVAGGLAAARRHAAWTSRRSRATTRPGNVRRLCAKARQPVRDDLLAGARAWPATGMHVGAVCVYHALRARRGRGARAAAASRWPRSPPAFPPGSDAARPASSQEIRALGRGGRRARSTSSSPARHVLTGDWRGALRRGARVPRGLRRRAHEDDPRPPASSARCATWRARARSCMMAGADFIKTSTGKEPSTPRCRSAW